MPHTPEEELIRRIDAIKEKVNEGDVVQHYSAEDKTYDVKEIGLLEASEEPAVVYKARYGSMITWIRTADEFLAEVEFEGKIMPRFKKVDTH